VAQQVSPLIRAEGKSLFDVVTCLIDMGKLDQDTARVLELNEHWCPTDLLLPADYVPANILTVTCIIQTSSLLNVTSWRRSLRSSGSLQFFPGHIAVESSV
jgi:hypothetical protein